MALLRPPSSGDNIQHYILSPYIATLYGREAMPKRWIRVVADGTGNFTTKHFTYANSSENKTISDIVETIELSSFLQFASYGFTPYLEVIFSDYNKGINLNNYKKLLLNQAALRNYEQRTKTLIALCKSKKTSLIGRSFTSNIITNELVLELEGTLILWKELMSFGNIHPNKCLLTQNEKLPNYNGIPIKKFQKEKAELELRMYHNNFVDIPFKLTEEQRNQLFATYGITK